MGQHHQLFIITKIANRYRGLAALHHPWLSSATAPKRFLGLLGIFLLQRTAFRSNKNSWPPGDTMNAFGRSRGRTKTVECHSRSSPPVFLLGASFDVKGYNASAILEPFNMAFNGSTMTASLLLLLL